MSVFKVKFADMKRVSTEHDFWLPAQWVILADGREITLTKNHFKVFYAIILYIILFVRNLQKLSA